MGEITKTERSISEAHQQEFHQQHGDKIMDDFSMNDEASDSGWAMTRLKDTATGELSYELTFPTGEGSTKVLELPNSLTMPQMVAQVARYVVGPDRSALRARIVQQINQAPLEFILKPHRNGWWPTVDQPDAFVTPARVYGPGALRYRIAQSPPKCVGMQKGTAQEWNRTVGAIALYSNPIAFSVMNSIAATIVEVAGLAEQPVFNMHGESSSGKTGASMTGASVVGHPEAMESWDLTPRKFEEAAAGRNNLPFILNAAERARPSRLAETLRIVVHQIPDGRSTGRSAFVQDHLPDLSWSTSTLSNSNKTGPELAALVNLPWETQDSVRFIDIPVAPPSEGGVFDIAPPGSDPSALIKALGDAIQVSYGTILPLWVDCWIANPDRDRVRRLIDRFVKKTGPHTAAEERVARKFGLVYAAGKMAVAGGILDWPISFPLSVTQTLFERAVSNNRTTASDLSLRELIAHAIFNPDLVPRSKVGATIEIPRSEELMGAWFEVDGQEVVGLRAEGLRWAGFSPKSVVAELSEVGALLKGHGGKRARQVGIKIVSNDSTINSPRLFVLDPQVLISHVDV